jgi:hypothetical protein
MYVSLEGIRRKQAIIDAIQAVIFAEMSLAHTREKIAAIDETIAAHNAHAETLRAMVAVREASDSTIIADLRARDGLMPFKEVWGFLVAIGRHFTTGLRMGKSRVSWSARGLSSIRQL